MSRPAAPPHASGTQPPDIRPWTGRIMVAAIPLAALLAACTSVPLPPWTPAASPPVARAPASPPASVVTAPRPATPPADVQISPVAPPSRLPPSAGVAATPSSAPADLPAPYSAAVAARFPAPSVIYNTPGLQAGRTSFTTQTEIQAWLRDQAAAASRTPGVKAAVLPIGRSQRGEPLEALVLTHASGTDPSTLLATGRPTVLLLGQQHGDEPAGSEALLIIARELAQGLLRPALERINVVIVPRANPDGAAGDQRMTSGGLDMNRDHLLLNTPEAQALAQLTRDYRPTVVVDAHEYTVVGRFLEKFGTVQKFDALLQYATTANIPEFLTKAAEEWYRRPLLAALRTQGLSTEWYYTTSTDLADKKISMGGTQPDTGRNVNGLKNAVSLLIETRGVGIGRLHIQRRVHTHVTAISSVLASTAQRASELNQLRPYLDKEVSAQACKDEAIVEAAATPAQYELLMLDPVSGADRAVTVDWDSALALRKVKARARPCGYWLSAGSAKAVDRLRLHGVQVMRVAEAGSMLGDSYQESSRTAGERQDVRGTIAGGAPVIKAQVSLLRGVVDVPRGSYYVPLNQPLGNLVLAALEPDTQSSYFANQILDGLQSTVRVMAEPAVKFEDLP
ncbi:MAG: M14 family zinc carboxypeptidase [Polaromonas sp.]|uniref:M14 family metallopeptidase n=1 Tax=Polaromonas sp. TaxID=1869339 RepID=UPI0027323AB5|nr:M14 family zinc carboxypeptidase [Polaromonas sp.]MDP3797492.1 M14 family zinc carboxypeptidase [Polaromonas sp.]